MVKSLTILFPPFDGIGHVNASIGVAEVLQARGHRIVFAINEQWRGKMSVYGFKEELISDPNRDPNADPTKYWTEHVLNMGCLMELSPIEIMKVRCKGIPDAVNNIKRTNIIMKEIVEKISPDLIVIDNTMTPSLLNCGIPWVYIVSCNPLSLYNDERLPPHEFGLSVNGDKNEWIEMKNQRKELLANFRNEYHEWMIENGLNKVKYDENCYKWFNKNGLFRLEEMESCTKSPYLNIYGYPEEIDYSIVTNSIPTNFYRIDSFIRSEKNCEFVIPDNFKNKSGKLIYFSLGSMGSGNVNLMKRLVSILSKSPYKFIVSKGLFHSQYELADNMWGERTVPQTKVLPIVDLVITHGGNNTFTESLYFGKPMIAMPFFGDQYDNAQRLEDTGYGIRLDGFKCTDTELLEAIENLLNNQKLAIKLEKMSKRMQSSNCLTKAAELIENLALNKQ